LAAAKSPASRRRHVSTEVRQTDGPARQIGEVRTYQPIVAIRPSDTASYVLHHDVRKTPGVRRGPATLWSDAFLASDTFPRAMCDIAPTGWRLMPSPPPCDHCQLFLRFTLFIKLTSLPKLVPVARLFDDQRKRCLTRALLDPGALVGPPGKPVCLWVAANNLIRLQICGDHGWLTRRPDLDDRQAFGKNWMDQYPGALLLHISRKQLKDPPWTNGDGRPGRRARRAAAHGIPLGGIVAGWHSLKAACSASARESPASYSRIAARSAHSSCHSMGQPRTSGGTGGGWRGKNPEPFPRLVSKVPKGSVGGVRGAFGTCGPSGGEESGFFWRTRSSHLLMAPPTRGG